MTLLRVVCLFIIALQRKMADQVMDWRGEPFRAKVVAQM